MRRDLINARGEGWSVLVRHLHTGWYACEIITARNDYCYYANQSAAILLDMAAEYLSLV